MFLTDTSDFAFGRSRMLSFDMDFHAITGKTQLWAWQTLPHLNLFSMEPSDVTIFVCLEAEISSTIFAVLYFKTKCEFRPMKIKKNNEK